MADPDAVPSPEEDAKGLGNIRYVRSAEESRLLRAQAQVNDLPFPAIPAVNEPLPRQ